MAGDIFFTDSLVWSASSNGIVDIIRRAIQQCHRDEDAIIAILTESEEIRCLGINLVEQRELKVRLTQLIMEVARGKLEELQRDPDACPVELRLVEELVDAA